MKKKISFAVLFIFCTLLLAAEELRLSIEDLLKYEEVEPVSFTFKNIKSSDLFIDKFHLTDDEIVFIGSWLKNDFVPKQPDTIPDIGTVYFYPNRIMQIPYIIENGFKYIFTGEWKVDNGHILIKPLYILKLDTKVNFYALADFTDLSAKSKYVSIGKIEQYEKAYVQTKPWNFSKLDFTSANKDFKPAKDILRYRLVREHAIPTIHERVATNDKLRYFMLNPVYDDAEYMFQLYCYRSRVAIIYEWK